MTPPDGKELAASIYRNKQAGAFQVRDKQGHKYAEFDNATETADFLKGRNCTGYEVWILSKRPPSDILEITSAQNYLSKF